MENSKKNVRVLFICVLGLKYNKSCSQENEGKFIWKVHHFFLWSSIREAGVIEQQAKIFCSYNAENIRNLPLVPSIAHKTFKLQDQ